MSAAEDFIAAARVRLTRIRLRTLVAPAGSPRHWVASFLAVCLGFGIVTAWQGTRSVSGLANARPEQLLAILDNLAARQKRLQDEQDRLITIRAQLQAGSKEAALREAKVRLNALRVLAGTTRVSGPGVTVTINDPHSLIPAAMIVDAVSELRDAGAEALMLGPVRLTATSWIADAPTTGLLADGRRLTSPYVLSAIGDAHTMSVALGIPGGVVSNLRAAGAPTRVASQRRLVLAAAQRTR